MLKLLSFAAVLVSATAFSCVTLDPTVTVDWCLTNCQSNPPYCPVGYCSCTNGSATQVQGTVYCDSISPVATMAWCNAVCNANPPNCPSGFCSCTSSPLPSPSVQPSANALATCIAIALPATNTWCTDSCNAGYCPQEFCTCVGNNVPFTQYVALSSCKPVFTDSWCQATCSKAPNSSDCTLCCIPASQLSNVYGVDLAKPSAIPDQSNTLFFYASNRQVSKIALNTQTGVVLANEVCANEFVSAMSIAVDENQGVYVADQGASQVIYINPVCAGKTTVIPFGHTIASPIDLEILSSRGTLLVSSSGNPGIYEVRLDANQQIVSFNNTGATRELGTGLAECYDTDGHNGFLFVSQYAFLNFFDFNTQTTTNIVSPAFGANDIMDVEYRPGCGLFFAASDKNKVYQCGVNMNSSKPDVWNSCIPPIESCHPICDNLIDSSSCVNLMAPTGLTLDCYCNIFTSNLGNGNLVGYTAAGPEYVFTNQLFATDIDIYGPNFCQPIPSPSLSRTTTPSPSVSKSSTPSSSVSPTPTRSPTSTPSVSPTSTSTPTVSPTSTSTPSSSVTPTASVTATSSVTITPTTSPTSTVTPTTSVTATASVTVTPSSSPTNTPSPTATISPTSSVTETPSTSTSVSPSDSPTSSASISPTPSSQQSPSNTVTPTVSVSPSPSESPTTSTTSSASASSSSSPTPSTSPSITPSVTTSVTRSVTRSRTVTPSITASPTPSPSTWGLQLLMTTFNSGCGGGSCTQTAYQPYTVTGGLNPQLTRPIVGAFSSASCTNSYVVGGCGTDILTSTGIQCNTTANGVIVYQCPNGDCPTYISKGPGTNTANVCVWNLDYTLLTSYTNNTDITSFFDIYLNTQFSLPSGNIAVAQNMDYYVDIAGGVIGTPTVVDLGITSTIAAQYVQYIWNCTYFAYVFPQPATFYAVWNMNVVEPCINTALLGWTLGTLCVTPTSSTAFNNARPNYYDNALNRLSNLPRVVAVQFSFSPS